MNHIKLVLKEIAKKYEFETDKLKEISDGFRNSVYEYNHNGHPLIIRVNNQRTLRVAIPIPIYSRESSGNH